jgi:hypothetical protein
MDTTLALSADQAEIAVQHEEITIRELLVHIPLAPLQTQDDYEYVGGLSTQISARMKTIESERVEMKKPALELGRKIDALFNRPLEALKAGKSAVDKLLTGYRQAQAEKARLEQERVNAAIRKEEERLRKLAEARAVRAEAKGDVERAEEIRENVPSIPIPVVQAEPPKLAGVAFRTDWKAEVVGMMDLARAVAAGQVPIDALLPNDKYLGQTARALKSSMRWPGVRVWSVEVPVNSGR